MKNIIIKFIIEKRKNKKNKINNISIILNNNNNKLVNKIGNL